MRDAACVAEQGERSSSSSVSSGSGRSVIEEHLRRGILLVKIWQEVLSVKFAGEKKDLFGRLDEFKREMWLLLVAAGSGYLARCWHKTLKPSPHSQLSDHAYEDPDERPGSPNYSSPYLTDSSSPNGMRYASYGHHVSPRGSGRSFSSKGLSKKLFQDVGQGPPRTPQKDKEGDPNGGPDDTKRLIGGGIEKSLEGGTRTDREGRRSPWSSFKAKKKQGSVDDAEKESSAGCLKRTGEKFRWVRERRKSTSDNESSSSRSLQALLVEGEGAGSSSREFAHAARSKSASIDLDRSTLTGLIAGGADVGKGDSHPPKPFEEQMLMGIVRGKVSQFEQAKTGSSSTFKVSSDGAKSTSSSASKDDASSSGVKEEKGNLSLKAETVNAVLSLRAANLAQAQAQAQALAQAQAMEREKLRNLKLESIASTSQEEEDALGGKGKRRTDLVKVPGGGEVALLPALLSGKRTMDSNKPMSRDSSEVTLATLTGKRMKDRELTNGDTEDQAESCLASVFGPIDLSQVFFGFDSMFFGSPKEEKSPARGSRRSKNWSRPGNRNLRRMRESPKPVSAIESCLRAQQFTEESPHVSRTLNFNSYGRGGERSPSFGQSDESPSPSTPSRFGEFGERKGKNVEYEGELQTDELKGVIGLPALGTPRRRASSSHRKEAESYKGGLELVLAESNFPRNVISEETERIYPSQSKLNDVVWRRTLLPVSLKKRKVSQAVTPTSIPADTTGNAYEFEALVIPPMEGLLFSFGVGIGVMSTMEQSESEIERLGRLLQESEERIQHLNDLLRESRQITADFGGLASQQLLLAGSMPNDGRMFLEVGNNKPQRNVLALVPVFDETGRERTDLFRKEAPETPQQMEHMAELEAELEAELGLLTAGISEDFNGTPDFDELDPEGVAGVADRDLIVEGLPAVLELDDDNDDFVPADVPTHSGGGVHPRELARLLRKVQNSRQEHQIHTLEADLIEAEERLQQMEMELQELKERIGSSAPPSAGDTRKASDLAPQDSQPEMGSHSSQEIQPDIRREEVPEGEERPDNSSAGASLEGDSAIEAKKLVSEQFSPTLPERPSPSSCIAPSSSLRGSVKSLMLSEESMETEAQAANDAVCDEFLSSVVGTTSEGTQFVEVEEEEEDLDSPEFNVSVIEMPLSPVAGDKSKEPSEFSNNLSISSTADPSSCLPDAPSTASGEDLDHVVGELLRRDSSTVKNAIKEFLLRERAEADESNPNMEELLEEEAAAAQVFSRRAAGKYSTPQKSMISSRLEQLARSSFSSDKPPVLERIAEAPPPPFGTAKLDDKTMRLFGLCDREASANIKERHQSPLARRETAKAEASKVNVAKEGGSRLASVDLSAADSDFQSLLEKRRELRYASSKVGLSLAGAPPAPERDAGTYYRHREDPSRAGTNSPIQKLANKSLFHSPHSKNTRISIETQNNRLYQNPMSDWLAEVGSPPSEAS